MENVRTRKLFINVIQSKKRKDIRQDFTGYFTKLKEHLSRCQYIAGGYMHAYWTLHFTFKGYIHINHLIEYWAFCSTEMNGNMLINEIATTICMEERWCQKTKIALMSSDKGEFYIILTNVAREVKGNRFSRSKKEVNNKNGSSTSCRYRQMEPFKYLSESDRSNVTILIEFFENVAMEACSVDVKSQEWLQILKTMVDRKLRNDSKHVIKSASVKGNVAIQLGGVLGLLQKEAVQVAFIATGENGYYQCVNACRNSKQSKDLTTNGAEVYVEDIIEDFKFRRTGQLNKAAVDQICCRWWRKKNNSLKYDVYLFNRWNNKLQLFFRWHPTRCIIQVFINQRWRNIHEYWVSVYELKRFK